MTAKKPFHLSIPLKIVLFTGAVYILVFTLWHFVFQSSVLEFLQARFEMGAGNLYVIFQIAVLAGSATLATYLFLERPLQRLTGTVHEAAGGNFLVRAKLPPSSDELTEMAQAFNMLLSRMTDISAERIQAEADAVMVREQTVLRERLEEKGAIIEWTNRALELLVRDLSLIYEIGQEVNSIIDLEHLYSKITVTLKRYLKLKEFAIFIYDERREELQVKAAFGFPSELSIMGTVFRKGEGITGLAAETGKKIYIKDTGKETRFLHYKGEKPSEVSSFLSVPLIFKEEVMGVINFGRLGVGSFTYQDVKMLSLVANQIALALANARLYTRTRELSVKDELTNINNRRHFQQMLQMEWKRAMRFKRQLSLIMLDVDHFKLYNDTHGHLQGDRVLRQIGSILKRNLREVDTVARFGGEEFVLLLPDTDKRGAIAVAEKVRGLVEVHNFMTEDHRETRKITISAGVAAFPDDVSEMDDLIDHADIALYRAKENGRNRIECYVGEEGPEKEEGKAVIIEDERTEWVENDYKGPKILQ